MRALGLAAPVLALGMSWLALADLYWRSGQRRLAANAYRDYLESVAAPEQRHRDGSSDLPVLRAVQRAATSPSPDANPSPD